MAAAAGAHVVASARAEDEDRCRTAGATAVADHRDPSLPARIRAAAPEGAGVHIGTSGHHDLETAVGLLASGGRIVLPAGTDVRAGPPVGPLYVKDGRLLGFVISNASATDLSRAAATSNRMPADGSLPARIAGVLPLREAAEAHRRLETGRVRGRLVLRP